MSAKPNVNIQDIVSQLMKASASVQKEKTDWWKSLYFDESNNNSLFRSSRNILFNNALINNKTFYESCEEVGDKFSFDKSIFDTFNSKVELKEIYIDYSYVRDAMYSILVSEKSVVELQFSTSYQEKALGTLYYYIASYDSKEFDMLIDKIKGITAVK